MATLARKMSKLTPQEQYAVVWARSNYRKNWRQYFAMSREDAISNRPQGWSAEAWGRIHDNPFGNEFMNRQVHTIRRLLSEKRI